MAKVLVLNVSSYDFVNQETGERIKGNNMYYTDCMSETKDGSNGIALSKVKLSDEIVASSKIYSVELPAVFELDTLLRQSLRGSTTMIVSDLKFVKPYKIDLTGGGKNA